MTQQEFQKRCENVFDTQVGDEFYSIELFKASEDETRVIINMSEIDKNGERVYFNLQPYMETRPQALDYLLGKRDDFND